MKRDRETGALAPAGQVAFPAAADRHAAIPPPGEDQADEPVDRAAPDPDQRAPAARAMKIALGGLAIGGRAIIHGGGAGQ